METKEFERLARLEQQQTYNIRSMDQHISEDHKMLGEIRMSIKDIYDKLAHIDSRQTRLETIVWLVGSLIVLFTPIITGIIVAFLK